MYGKSSSLLKSVPGLVCMITLITLTKKALEIIAEQKKSKMRFFGSILKVNIIKVKVNGIRSPLCFIPEVTIARGNKMKKVK